MMSAALLPCTFFMSTLNGRTYFGNNEDSAFDQTNVWFIPGEGEKHGYVCFGYNTGFPQGGMNDQGLCFDGASTPRVNIRFSPDKKAGNLDFLFRIMADCSTVEEVAEIIRMIAVPGLKFQGQLMFADKQGDAIIVGGPDKNGDLDIIPSKGKVMVCANFFPNHPELGGSPSRRYDTAARMLKANPDPSVENFRAILQAVSVPKTQYSNIFDLNTGEILVYHFHDFSRAVQMNLTRELQKGAHAYRIVSLFSKPDSGGTLDEINRKRAEGKISRMIPEFIENKGF